MAEPTRAEDCDLAFAEGLAVGDGAEVALEDYARVMTAALRAEAVRDEAAGGRVTAVRVIAPASPPTADQHRDIEDFARGLAEAGGGLGLGWG
jgi:hypothetical protein